MTTTDLSDVAFLRRARTKVREDERAEHEQRVQSVAEELVAAERQMRARAAAVKARAEKVRARDATKQNILEAAGGAMVALRTFVAKLREIMSLYATLRKQTAELGEECESAWGRYEVPVRYGFRLAAELGTLPEHRNSFGCLSWSLHGVHPAGGDWIKNEMKILAMGDKS